MTGQLGRVLQLSNKSSCVHEGGFCTREEQFLDASFEIAKISIAMGGIDL